MSREESNSPPPAAGPLEDDDLLSEILLRLPPLPSSLPRASAVSRLWRNLVSDPRFSRRFRSHHRRNPPLLGCFVYDFCRIRFEPALEAPNSVPQCRFSFPTNHGDRFVPIGSRHGLVLCFDSQNNKLLVWDPVTGDQSLLHIPPGFGETISAAVLRAAGDVRYFEVVLVGTNTEQVLTSVYSSKTDSWGNLTTAPLRPGASSGMPGTWVDTSDPPPVMVGDSLYWFLVGNSHGILEFNLGTRSPRLLPLADEEVTSRAELRDMLLMMAEGGGLGLLLLSVFTVQLWKRETNCDGVTSWVLGRSIALDKLLSLDSKLESPYILGFDEDSNSVFLWTSIGTFTVQLESLQFKKLCESKSWYKYFPLNGVYTADKGIGDGHDGPELRSAKCII